MRALLKPKRQGPTAEPRPVTCINRKAGGKVTVQFDDRRYLTVDGFRLSTMPPNSRRLTQEEIGALPWTGKGDDPLAVGAAP